MLTFALTVLSTGAQDSLSNQHLLGSGDQISVSVFGEPDLAISQRLDSSGKIVMPLLGEVILSGYSIREAEDYIEDRFKTEDFLVKPEVTVQVIGRAQREFYVFGEVRGPGMKLFPADKNRISMIEAISIAGDFTEFANTKAVQVTRRDEEGREQNLTVDVRKMFDGSRGSRNSDEVWVYPGDVILVKQSW